MEDPEAAQAALHQVLGQAVAAAQAAAQAAANSAQLVQAARPDQRTSSEAVRNLERPKKFVCASEDDDVANWPESVSYTHLRAHETSAHL
eukprot:13686469-Alexandrium_andersonii.AAC.1